MAAKWHISKDGIPRKCDAKVQCPLGAGTPHYPTLAAALKAAEEAARETAPASAPLTKSQTAGAEAGGDVIDESTRITTLLTARIPLADDRKGKVPAIKPDDLPYQVVSKLGRYLEANFDGDAEQTSTQALTDLFHANGLRRVDGSDDPQVAHLLDNYEWRNGSRPLAFVDDDNAVYVVCLGKTPQRALKANARFVRSNRSVHSVSFAQLLATREAMSGIDFTVIPDEERRKDMEDRVRTTLLNKVKFGYYTGNNMVMDDELDTTGLADYLGHEPPSDPRALLQAYDTAIADMNAKGGGGSRTGTRSLRVERDRAERHLVRPADKAMESMANILDDERNGEMNRAYAQRANNAHSATVYEDKKNMDDEHVRAGRASAFARDFGHIEVDDSVDLGKFKAISDEYGTYSAMLPKQRVTADFRFRKTGRHHATGVYTPAVRNIAVDPRSPSSFTHEYMHHLDFTDKPGMQLSMTPGFRGIVRDYSKTLDRSKAAGTDISNYIAPTEVFARAGELWMHWSHPNAKTSFLQTDDEYSKQFDYAPLLAHKQEIMDLFGSMFGGKS
jgi:hypothetical protein